MGPSINPHRTMTRRHFMRLVAGLAVLTITALARASLAVVSSTLDAVDDYVGSHLRHVARRGAQELDLIVGPPLRAIGVWGRAWEVRYDDSQLFDAARASRLIRVDQVGYRPADPKIAKLTAASEEFAVVDAAVGQPVFRGRPALRTAHDDASGDSVYDLDFSPVAAPGRYYLDVSGVGRSFEFAIGDRIYDDVLSTVLRGFYLQRCGAPVLDDRWGHLTCHAEDGYVWGQDGKRIDTTGGWHDAGDYGKYVPSAARATTLLLSAFEFYQDGFWRGNAATPRILTEARWELEWLRKMQAPDGGVYHKVTTKDWDDDVAPDNDRNRRFVFGVSTAATADFAAVMAAAGRVYARFDRAFATQALADAERAWTYLELHPTIEPTGGFHNPDGVTTGEYTESDDSDERFWAAAELFRATGKATFDRYVRDGFRKFRPFFAPPPHVMRVQGPGALAYIMAEPMGGDTEIRRTMQEDLVQIGREVAAKADGQGYQVALAKEEYYWGSNGVDLSYAIALLYAEHFSGYREFAAAALDQLHYVFGRNTLGKSFVTGVGANPVMRPHSEMAIANQQDTPAPGLLSGGPNGVDSGGLARYSARDYVDDSDNFTVNETGIDMNAALVFVLARFVGEETPNPPP